MQCHFCDAELKGKLRCPGCRAWNGSGGVNGDDDVVFLSDAKLVPLNRISTGFPLLDKLFSTQGGIVDYSTALIGGAPGAGKSTLQLQVADFVLKSRPDRVVLIVATEQQPDAIKEIGERLHIQTMNRIGIVKAMGGLRSNLYEKIQKYKPVLTFVDSLSSLVGDDPKLAIEVTKKIKELITVCRAGPAILISQINKEFDFAGFKKLEHEVDTTMMLDKDDETGERVIYSTKNRNAEAPQSYSYDMTERGLVERPLTLEDSEEED